MCWLLARQAAGVLTGQDVATSRFEILQGICVCPVYHPSSINLLGFLPSLIPSFLFLVYTRCIALVLSVCLHCLMTPKISLYVSSNSSYIRRCHSHSTHVDCLVTSPRWPIIPNYLYLLAYGVIPIMLQIIDLMLQRLQRLHYCFCLLVCQLADWVFGC
jgi:hypothetical protein